MQNLLLDLAKNPMPPASKKEFIEQWLVTQHNVFHCESASDDLSTSHISDLVKSKRNRTSPSRNLKQIKHFKSVNESNKSLSSVKGRTYINSLLQSTESRIYKNNGKIKKIFRSTFSINIFESILTITILFIVFH